MPAPGSPPKPDCIPNPDLGAGAGSAGRRHLARARLAVSAGWQGARRQPAGAPLAVVLLGASAPMLPLAGLLAQRGCHVTIIEDDPDAATRLAEQLARSTTAISVARDDGPLAGAGLIVAPAGSGQPPAWLAAAQHRAPPDAVMALLAETGDQALPALAALPDPARAAVLRLVAPGGGLIECLAPPGGDAGAATTAGRIAALAGGLGCLALPVPPGTDGAAAALMARLDATVEALCFAGAAPWDLDDAAEASGFAAGPCALMDRLGVDTALRRRALLVQAGIALPDPGVIARMVAEGRLGRRGSVGWYRYPGGGGRVTDPLIEDLVREEAWFAGHPPRHFDTATLQRHLLAALIDEAARLLAAGAVARPADIDLAAVLALGFPPRLGGPVWLADRWGAGAALAAIQSLAADLDGLAGLPPPAPALVAAARTGTALSAALPGD